MIQTQGGVTVWLDTALDDALVGEGRARELVNRIQKLRKDLGFEVTDRIRVKYDCPPELKPALKTHKDYITGECLASLFEENAKISEWTSNQDIDGLAVNLHIEKI